MIVAGGIGKITFLETLVAAFRKMLEFLHCSHRKSSNESVRAPRYRALAQVVSVLPQKESFLPLGSPATALALFFALTSSQPLRAERPERPDLPGQAQAPFSRQSCHRCRRAPPLSLVQPAAAGNTFHRSREIVPLSKNSVRTWLLPRQCEYPRPAQCSSLHPPQRRLRPRSPAAAWFAS